MNMENDAKRAALVTLIIPVYNTESYLRQCLDSAVGQTYPAIELMIVDDGSTDGSGGICDEYAEKDPRVRVFHTKNGGVSAARNFALDRMRGDYAVLLDSDDWLETNAIEILVGAALAHDADMVTCRYYSDWVNLRKASGPLKSAGVIENPQFTRAFILEPGIENMPWNKLYRRELFEGVRYPEGKRYEDVATTYRLIGKVGRAVMLSDALYHYRQRETSISNTYSIPNMIEYWEAHYARSAALAGMSPECDRKLTGYCIGVIGQMWRWYGAAGSVEQNDPKALRTLDRMQEYVKEHYDEVMHGASFTRFQKLVCLCARTRNPALMKFLSLAIRFYRKSRKAKTFA